MKSDIEIPIVKDVYVAAVLENHGAEEDVWDIYFINDKNEPLESVMITSRGYMETEAGTEIISSTLRHKLGEVPAKTAVKVEIILPQVFEIYNEYWATFFCENKLLERKFVFGPFTIDKNFIEDLPVISAKGILVK